MSAVERPHIELYMYSLNQEFPVSSGHSHFLKSLSETKVDVAGKLVKITDVESQVFSSKGEDGGWSWKWISNDWITNTAEQVQSEIDDFNDPMLHIQKREEDFGGILFDTLNDRVYKLNVSGMQLFNELVQEYVAGKRNLSGYESASFPLSVVTPFVEFLRGAGIWIPR